MTHQPFTFEEIFEDNKRRIHYHIHRLNIRDPQQEFFQIGTIALWDAFKQYQPDKGPMSTYFNYTIRNRLIDHIRKTSRVAASDDKVIEAQTKEKDDGNQVRRNETSHPLPDLNCDIPISDDNDLWCNLKRHLTANQWKWVRGFILEDLTLPEIAVLEQTTTEAVKSWGKQVRKKLRDETFRQQVGWMPHVPDDKP